MDIVGVHLGPLPSKKEYILKNMGNQTVDRPLTSIMFQSVWPINFVWLTLSSENI